MVPNEPPAANRNATRPKSTASRNAMNNTNGNRRRNRAGRGNGQPNGQNPPPYGDSNGRPRRGSITDSDSSSWGEPENVNQMRVLEYVAKKIQVSPIPKSIKAKMNDFLGKFAAIDEELVERSFATTTLGERDNGGGHEDHGDAEFDEAFLSHNTILNILSSKAYSASSEINEHIRNKALKVFVNMIRPHRENSDNPQDVDHRFRRTREKLKKLPIFARKAEILRTIAENQVVVISGDTGCGKTTQVPQYIFEHFINEDRGSEASIVVTQPRRLAAVSVAERVAYEFGEDAPGKSIGYQVRFRKELPIHDFGGILYCTTGMLLRKMENNLLKGISHIVVDELHERNVDVDLLMVLIKRIISTNRDLRVILMSATINGQQFADYFGPNTPILQISGRCFGVETIDLRTIKASVLARTRTYEKDQAKPRVKVQLVVDLILSLHRMRNDNNDSVLVFLPGMKDIEEISNALKRHNTIVRQTVVKPIKFHSTLPIHKQNRVFEASENGVRKVILATNIAETSLTVPDIVYAIDTGLCKEMMFDRKANCSRLGTRWISKANATQRKGRVGRAREGFYFQLFEDQVLEAMEEFPNPEMLRIPLENVVMSCKLYFPGELAYDVLSEAMNPPEEENLEVAIDALEWINVLDSDENLTTLGRRIVAFPLEPMLSVALVYGTMFGICDPTLNAIGVLTSQKPPFRFGRNQEIRGIKERFKRGAKSDHCALANVMEAYEFCATDQLLEDFKYNNNINGRIAQDILGLKEIYYNNMFEAKFVGDAVNKITDREFANEFAGCQELMLGALVAGFYPRIAIQTEHSTMVDLKSGIPIMLGGDSVARSVLSEIRGQASSNGEEDSILTYFVGHVTDNAKQLVLKEASVISPLTFLLFAAKKLQLHEDVTREEPTKITLLVDANEKLQFLMSKCDLDVLQGWRRALKSLMYWFISSKKPSTSELKDQAIDTKVAKLLDDFLDITQMMLYYE